MIADEQGLPNRPIADRAAELEDRPSLVEAAEASAAKEPWCERVATAAANAAGVATVAVQQAGQSRARAGLMRLARDYVQGRVQVLKLVEDLTGKGFLTTGSRMDDVRNGALHVGPANRHYYNLNDLTFAFAMVKSMRLGFPQPQPDDGTFLDKLKKVIAPPFTPALISVGARSIQAPADQDVRNTDMFGFAPVDIIFLRGGTTQKVSAMSAPTMLQEGDVIQPAPRAAAGLGAADPNGPLPTRITYPGLETTYAQDLRDVGGRWAIGALVQVGAPASPVLDLSTLGKTAAQVAAWVQDYDLAKLGSFFTETLGTFFDKEGMDFFRRRFFPKTP